jgi:predicted nucleic acid-binding protein
VIVHIDTSALIDALTGPRRSLPRLAALVHEGHRIAISSLVYYEWRRGPRTRAELTTQESVLPLEGVVPVDAGTAALAATLYAKTTKARGREIDLVIAACALSHGAALWTLNAADFRDIPDLTLV